MVDISSQNNKINVTVSSSGNTANTNVTPDYAQYYSNKSKEWAISNRIVDNTDYSSKYYANESKKQADISTAKATEVIESGNTAVTNIESARDNAIIDITNQENLSVDNVNTAGATQVSSVNTAGITQVANVNSAGTTQINLAKEQVTLATNQANIATEQATIATNKASEVVESGNTALSNIDTAKTGALTDITNLKNTSVSNITTAKNNAITSITTQETTSKNNVIATGNEQVERVNLTGVDNRTPIFSKNEIGTNEGVYKNVYDLKHSTFDKSKFTVVGSPTITDDGIVSGFSGANDISVGFPSISGNELIIEGVYSWNGLYPTSSSGVVHLLGDNKLTLFQAQDGRLELYRIISNQPYYDFGRFNILANTPLKYIITLTLTSLNITCYQENTEIYNKTVMTNLPNISDFKSLRLSPFAEQTQGSSDLKQFSITVDGKEVFSGNKTGIDVINDIEIPYTLSKTGSKIVDVAYRDRVIDLYEQEGKAGYYTIDEENKNFTLPMGEVYGMIEQKADAGRIGEQLAGKVNLDLANLSSEGKEAMTAYWIASGSPKINIPINLTISTTTQYWEAPSNGYVWFYMASASSGAVGFIGVKEEHPDLWSIGNIGRGWLYINKGQHLSVRTDVGTFTLGVLLFTAKQ